MKLFFCPSCRDIVARPCADSGFCGVQPLDDAGRDLPQAFAAPASIAPFFHDQLTSAEAQ